MILCFKKGFRKQSDLPLYILKSFRNIASEKPTFNISMRIFKRTYFSWSLICVVLIVCAASCKKNEEAVATPVITNFSPTSAIAGSAVTISGSNFNITASSNIVKFNGVDAVVTGVTSTSLYTSVPAGTTTGKITVSVNGRTATSSADFVVLTPSITKFLPTSGIVGTAVVISGSNFDPIAVNNVVKFNGIAAVVASATSDELIVIVPEMATSGNISVTSGGTTATSAISFAVPSPTITSLSPTIGSKGVIVVVTGTNFSANKALDIVEFNGMDATVLDATSTQITTFVPAFATTGKVSVKVGANMVTSTGDFTICSGIELLLSNVELEIPSNLTAGSTSFNYGFELTNVGRTQAVLTTSNSTLHAYVSADDIYNNGNDLSAGSWGIYATIDGGGEGYLTSFPANISGGTVGDHPYLILVFSTTSAITECNTSIDHIVIRKIFP